MEHNLFASFSYCGPREPSKFSRARASSGVPLSCAPSRVTKSKDVKQECSEECSSVALNSDDCRNAENAQIGAHDLRPVREVAKHEGVEDQSRQLLSHVKEVNRENQDALSATLSREDKRILSALSGADSPPAMKSKRLHLASSCGVHGEIEDFGHSKHPNPAIKKNHTLKRAKESRKCGSREWITPANWEGAIETIKIMREGRDAPVDKLGPAQLVDLKADSETQKFHVLVAAMISSQTRDTVTAAAMKRLHAMPGGLTVQRLAETDVSLELLEELLKPVGFYRQKAKYLKGIAEILLKTPYCGSVPCKLDELMKLPGVGPKVASLVLWVAFGLGEEGLIVDTNMRRVCCRLGWAPEGSTPEQVREALESWLPKKSLGRC